MRDAISQASIDMEESYFSKNVLFLCKSDLSFYHMELYIPYIPLIEGFRNSFAPLFFSQTRNEKKSMALGAEMGCVCFAAALI